jgi:hypothetical protein
MIEIVKGILVFNSEGLVGREQWEARKLRG